MRCKWDSQKFSIAFHFKCVDISLRRRISDISAIIFVCFIVDIAISSAIGRSIDITDYSINIIMTRDFLLFF